MTGEEKGTRPAPGVQRDERRRRVRRYATLEKKFAEKGWQKSKSSSIRRSSVSGPTSMTLKMSVP